MHKGSFNIRSILSIVKILRRYNPDIIQTWMYHADLVGGFIAKIAGFKSILWGVHNVDLDSSKAKRSTVLIKNICTLFSKIIPNQIICSSPYAARHHQLIGYPLDKISVINNGVNIKRFYPNPDVKQPLKFEMNIPESIPLLGMVGRYDPYKDHITLLKALKLIKEKGQPFCCLLIGSGMDSQNDDLIYCLTERNLLDNVILLGQRNDMGDVMNLLDVHILSSISESFGNVLAEAMACGVPCITTDIGMPSEIVGNTGWIVPPSNPEKLAKAIIESINSMQRKESWEKRKKRCREKIVDNYSEDRMVQKYKNVWDKHLI